MLGLESLYLLDPSVTFLNHGSFGATPRPVFEIYQDWQRRLEWEPVQFLVEELPRRLAAARRALADYVNADADDLVYVPNATFALNVVARSLALGPGDAVLSSDHEYGACANTWHFLAGKRGFRFVQQRLPLPLPPADELVEHLWQAVTPRTKVIYISHITSPTAQRLPVEAICARARAEGMLTIVDGAHTLGQIPLDLAAVDADFYFSNAHKWLSAPKGAAFLYARRDRQPLIEPLVVGWGWGPERTFTFGSDYIDYLQWLGTNDLSAYLSVPAAIDFQEEHDWPQVRRTCHELLCTALARVGDLTGLDSPYAGRDDLYAQMAIAPLPPMDDLPGLKRALFDRYGVEVPLIQWQERQFVRVSVQGYNRMGDVDRLLLALQALLPASRQP